MVTDELDRCRAYLEPALRRNGGTHEWDDIVQGISEGRLQLWPAPEGALVTELVTYPRKKICNVFLGGGRMTQLLDMIQSVEAWARAQECHGLTVQGRFGWERVLARFGARPQCIHLIKEFAP